MCTISISNLTNLTTNESLVPFPCFQLVLKKSKKIKTSNMDIISSKLASFTDDEFLIENMDNLAGICLEYIELVLKYFDNGMDKTFSNMKKYFRVLGVSVNISLHVPCLEREYSRKSVTEIKSDVSSYPHSEIN